MSEIAEVAVIEKKKGRGAADVNRTEDLSLAESAKIIFASGLIKDKEDLGKVLIKLSFGRSIGLSDISAVNGLSIGPNGTIVMGAALMLSLIKRTGKYRLSYKERNDNTCIIEVWEKFGNEWFSLGVPIAFSWSDAVRAGLSTKDTYRKYPRQLLTARAISDVFKACCSDACSGVACYTPEELDVPGLRTNPETLELESIPEAETKVVTKKLTKKLLDDINKLIKDTGADVTTSLSEYSVTKVEELSQDQAEHLQRILTARKKAK